MIEKRCACGDAGANNYSPLPEGALRVADAERFLARIGASNCAEMTET